jgi:hypothetical protein
MLSSHNDIEFERGGMGFTAHVPDAVELKIELEVESDERELDIELTGVTGPRPVACTSHSARAPERRGMRCRPRA